LVGNAGPGVIVRAVTPSSPAASSGLRAGDVIVAANGIRIGTRDELSKAWRTAAGRGGNTLVLQIRRNGEITILLLR
jgi:S1-C subfamily serine protease